MKNQKLTTHTCLIYLLPVLFLTFPIAAQIPVETNAQSDFSKSATQAVPSEIKITEPKIVLPEGYPISGRRAKLVKLPEDPRWFLIFDEAREKFIPELAKKDTTISKKINLKNANSSTGTAINQSKAVQTAKKSDVKSPVTASQKEKKSENPFSHPMEVLPGKWLTAMTKVIGKQVDLTVDFRIWGEVTTYHNRNYVLPTFVATLSLFGKDAAKKTEAKKINPLDASFGRPKASDTEISEQTQDPDKLSLPKKLRDALSAIPRTRPLELPDIKPSTIRPKPAVVKSVKNDDKEPSAQDGWRDGYMVIDRVGWIQFDPEGSRWMFTFEADGASLAEPPVVLHPCQLLEVMEKTEHQSGGTIRYRISGQISLYQGRNYLLLRKVLMVYALNNLIP
jgi:hypothetical protein